MVTPVLLATVWAIGVVVRVGPGATTASFTGTALRLPVTFTRSGKTQPCVSGSAIRYQGTRELRWIIGYVVPALIVPTCGKSVPGPERTLALLSASTNAPGTGVVVFWVR